MGYTVRPERLRALVTALADVRDRIREATPAQVEIAAPGAEPVSIGAARRLGLDLSLRHYEANLAQRAALEEALAKFGATVTEYLAREEAGTTTFGDT
jgi:hypothetical protein